jgi:NAD dependent epimerase/dehydratase family enzyme
MGRASRRGRGGGTGPLSCSPSGTVSLSEVADFLTASLRVMPRRALDKGYTFRFPELEPALRDLLGK